MSKPKVAGASDAEVIALLKRYQCPTLFHEVRTRFLGSIASPVLGASPMETVKQLWGGELPEFNTILESVITCPECGFAKQEVMPVDACQFYYECAGCKTLLRPKPGDCCGFCSFGSVVCPPIQQERECC